VAAPLAMHDDDRHPAAGSLAFHNTKQCTKYVVPTPHAVGACIATLVHRLIVSTLPSQRSFRQLHDCTRAQCALIVHAGFGGFGLYDATGESFAGALSTFQF
jgi:hypothetical protein